MSVWWSLLKKELLEISRDKRALLSGLGLAFLAPVIIYGGLGFAIEQASGTPAVWIKVINPDAAPALVELLAEARIHDIGTSNKPDAPADARLEVEFDPAFTEAIKNGKTAKVTLRGELNDDAVGPVLNRVQGVLSAFGSQTAGIRMLMRGVDPRLLRPLDIQEQNTAVASNNAGRMTMIIGIYVMMAAVISAIATAIDTSAGERERNVLEILLIQPVRALDIVTAKLVAIFLVAMLGVTLTLTFSALAMSQIELEKIGMAFTLKPLNFIAILLMMMPLALLGGSLNLLVGYFSKTFKEAQSQVTMVIMLPALAPMILVFMPEPPEVLRQIPVTGQFLYLEQIFKAETIEPLGPLLASGATLALAAVLVLLTARHLSSERSINAL